MRIAHISDLHFCSKHKSTHLSIAEKLIKLALDNGAEHFVITGDLSDNAIERDYRLFRDLLKKYDLFRSDKTTVVIGNHDIFGGPQTAQDVLNFPSKCLHISYNEKVSSFVDHFKELFQNTHRFHEELHFPFVKELKDIVLVGINSIAHYSRFKNLFASNGRVSKIQRKAIRHLISLPKFKNKPKFGLIHHHFYRKNENSKSSEKTMWDRIEGYTMKLRGKKKLLKLFKENEIRIVLHGHSHEMKEYIRKGIRFFNAGASVDGGSDNYGGVFLIDVVDSKVSSKLLKLPNEPIIFEEKELLSTYAA